MTNPILEKVSPVSFLGYGLKESGYEVVYAAPDKDTGYEQLLVLLKPDKRGRDLPIKIVFAEDIAAFYATQAGQTLPPEYGFTLQFILYLPIEQPAFQVKPDLARLLNVLNRRLPLGVYGLNKTEGIFLKYSLPVPTRDVKLELAADIIDTFNALIRKDVPHLDAYYSGKYKVEAIIQAIEKK